MRERKWDRTCRARSSTYKVLIYMVLIYIYMSKVLKDSGSECCITYSCVECLLRSVISIPSLQRPVHFMHTL